MYVHPSVVAARQPYPQFEIADVVLSPQVETSAIFRRTLDVNDVAVAAIVDPATVFGSVEVQNVVVSPVVTSATITYKPLGVSDVVVGVKAMAATVLLTGGILSKQDVTISPLVWPATIESRDLLKRNVNYKPDVTSADLRGNLPVQDVTVATAVTSTTLEVAALSVQNVTLSPVVTPAAVEGDFTAQDVTVEVTVSPTTIYEPIFTVQDVTVGTAATSAVLEDHNFDVQDVAVAVSATPVAVEGDLSVNDVTVIADATSARIYSGTPAGVRALWHFEESPDGLGPDGVSWTNVGSERYTASRFGHGIGGEAGPRATFPNPLDPTTESFTIEAWVCADYWTVPINRTIFFGQGDTGRSVNFTVFIGSPEYTTLGMYMSVFDSDGTFYGSTPPAKIDLPAAYHLVLTWDHTTLTAEGYVNGERILSEVLSVALRDTVYLGWNGGLTSGESHGVVTLDEVRLSEGVIYTGDPITVPTEPFIPQIIDVLQARRPYIRAFSTSAAIEYKTLSVNDVVLQSAITPVEVYARLLTVNDVVVASAVSSAAITQPLFLTVNDVTVGMTIANATYTGTASGVILEPSTLNTTILLNSYDSSLDADVGANANPLGSISYRAHSGFGNGVRGQTVGTPGVRNEIYRSAAFNTYPSSNLTVEGWGYCANSSPRVNVYMRDIDNLILLQFSIGNYFTGTLRDSYFNSIKSAGVWKSGLATGTWLHFAFVYDGGNDEVRFYIDGVWVWTASTSAITGFKRLAHIDVADNAMGIDELRISESIRYTGETTYTVPTGPFTPD